MERKLEVSFELGTIDHLGAKLYSTIPPMIAELISNAWDADAHNVYISFQEAPTKEIQVKDDGVGMSFEELNDKFLKIGRNRRTSLGKDTTDENRPVLGKKGLGKLSMFGIGKTITVSTVKDGKKNAFVMDYDEIKKADQGKYCPKLIADDQISDEKNGTTIKIENLARKTGFDLGAIRSSILSRFKIFSEDFIVHINNDSNLEIRKNEVPIDNIQFRWRFPEDFENEFDDKDLLKFGKDNNIVGTIYTANTPLRKDSQGIVLFSRLKLVQENKPFSKRGNDNFFQYMTGSFDVDFVDASDAIDNCSTDRKSLTWDTDESNELDQLNKLLETVVVIAQKKWRDGRKQNKIEIISKGGQNIQKWIESLNRTERPLAQKLINAIIENDDISKEKSAEYIQCIKEMYGFSGFQEFTAKLDELDQLGNENAIRLLTDWSEIEAKEYAKISFGRIKTIEKFEKFIQENASESKVIQKFLEEFPWLLDAKMSKFEREVTYTKVLKETFSDDHLPESDRRIDFLCTNDAGIIHVIELKRPKIKLTTKTIQQISEYVEFIRTHYPESAKEVKGYLISDNMTYEPGAETVRRGIEHEGIYIKSYSDLLAEARRYNLELYKSYNDFMELKNKQIEQ